MAKQLKDILKQAHDTIKGVRPSTTTDLSLGKDPGVDYDPKAGDEQDFVAKHSVQKFDDPNGNGADVFQATNVKHSQVAHAHGYKAPKDKKVNEESFDEAWIVTHKDGKVTTHAGQRDAMKASKQSPGSKVSATHGAMGQRAYDVLSPHQRGDMGTFSAAGYTPPEKKKKIKEDANLDKVNAVASDLKKMSQQPIKPMGQSNTSGSNLPNVNAPGAPDMFKEKKKVKEEAEELDELKGNKSGLTKLGYVGKAGKFIRKTDPKDIANDPDTERKFKNRMTGLKNLLKRTQKEEVEEGVRSLSRGNIKGREYDPEKLYKQTPAYVKPKSYRPKHEPSKAELKTSGDKAIADYLAKGGRIRKEEIEQVDEVLTKKDSASTWIRDFIKSKDPKFAGKSKKERQRMALGAYYAKQRNEEIEQVDELNKTTLGSYIKKASTDMAAQREKRVDSSRTDAAREKAHGKEYNRKSGIHRAVSKLTKESLAMPLLGGDMDDESAEMAKAQLKALAAKANALADQLSDDLMIEPWVQSKIAIAKDYVTTVHDYMVYGEHDKNDEQTGPDTPMTFPGMSVDVNTGRNV